MDIKFDTDIRFIVLKGHTFGHAGVAIKQGDNWLLHAGDTYYRLDEVLNPDSQVNITATHSADDNAACL